MSKEMSKDAQKKLLLVSAVINTLVDYEGQEKVATFIKEIQLDTLLTDMEEYFGECPYDAGLLDLS